MNQSIIFICFIFFSCSAPLSKQQEIYKATDRLLAYCKDGNEQAVYAMAYHVDYRNHITDPGSRRFMVSKFQKLIKKFGIPAHDKWHLRKTTHDYEVYIPIPNYNDPETEIKNVQIVISYTPPKIANGIYDFNVISEIDRSKMKPLVAPRIEKQK